MRITLVLASVGASCLLSCAASGQVVYTQQWRDVEASYALGTYEWIWATDFGPFDALVDRYSANPDGSMAQGRYMAHSSRLDPDRIVFTSETRAGAAERSGGTTYSTLARSQVNATFTLADPTGFTASISTTSVRTTVFDISLTRVGGPTIFSGAGAFSGLLAPGEYTFRAFISAEGVRTFDPISGAEVWFGSTATIDAVLMIPAPGAGVLAMLVGAMACRRRRR